MDKKSAADLIKTLIDQAVQRGLFKSSDDVITVQTAFNMLIAETPVGSPIAKDKTL